jgi:catechol 2,3-dioxygenase-like lactoylglutathione lyase family enzyme
MIDHVSIPVRDLDASAAFYATVLAEIGYTRLVDKPGTVGFGKKYADFWLNHRPNLRATEGDDGFHVCVRAGSTAKVDAFHAKAVALGARSDGAPGIREIYASSYYAAFVVDRDGNKVEVVTFVEA